MLFCAVFIRISVRFCGVRTPLTSPSMINACHIKRNAQNVQCAARIMLNTINDLIDDHLNKSLLSNKRHFLVKYKIFPKIGRAHV